MRHSVANKTVLNNSALAYGKLNSEYDAEGGKFYVNFTNEGLEINFHLHEGHKEMIQLENERLKGLGYNAKITGRKYHKINIIF